ncbi:MAG: MFS transporter [Solidesulfovibrio sp.]
MDEASALNTVEASVASSKPTCQRYLLAAILLIVVFFSYMDRVNVSILVADNTFLADMGIANQAVQKGLLMSVFLFAYMFGNVLLGPLGDTLGPRKAMCLSVVAWGISLVVGGFAITFMMMLFSRVLLGIAEGMHFPMQSKYIKQWFPPQERGKANAVWSAGMAVAPAIAMPFFTWIISITGWRNSFFVLTALGLIPLYLLWFMTTDTPQEHKKVNKAELDHIEAGLKKEATLEASRASGDGSFWSNVKLFATNYKFWLLVIYYMAHTSVLWGAMTWLPTYLKEARGFSWSAMGALASLPWILGVVTKIISGYLCDKFGRRAPILLFAMFGVGIGTYFGATASDNMTSAIILAFGIGSIGLGGPAAWTLMQDIVPSKGVSTAAGVMNGMGNGLSALAPVAIGFLISQTGSYAAGLFYIVGICVVGAIATLILTLKNH